MRSRGGVSSVRAIAPIVGIAVLWFAVIALAARPSTTRPTSNHSPSTRPTTRHAFSTHSGVDVALSPHSTTTQSAATQATTGPATTQAYRDESAETVAFLSSLYGKLLTSKDWMERSLGLISLARLPGHEATEMILTAVQNDATPAVRVVAWQCMLSRARFISSAEFQKWRDATTALVKVDAFRGRTRVGLLRMMAACEPTTQAKHLWAGIFAHTNVALPQDLAVLDALADCEKAWRSPAVIQFLYDRMESSDDAYRAEYVLHHAGCDAPWAGEHSDIGHNAMWQAAMQSYANWWRAHRTEWKEIAHPPEDAWRELQPQFVPAADLESRINRYDPKWMKELELGTPNIQGLDVVFVVDATGSMQWMIDYLKSDIARILRATALVSSNPRIGLTFYRDRGDMFVTRSTHLTSNLTELSAALSNMSAAGGGDVPEAVREGLTDALSNNPWRWDKSVRRAVVLITDAPPHPETQDDCEKIAAMCKEKEVSLYMVKASTAELPELDAIASAAGGKSVAIQDLQRWDWPYATPAMNGNAWFTQIARAPSDHPIDRQILGDLLIDAINPQFRDRAGPLIDIMLALCTDSTVEKRDIFGVATTPSPGTPVDPQAR